MKRSALTLVILSVVVAFTAGRAPGEESWEQLIKQVRQVGPKGAGHVEATRAWQSLAAADVDRLTDILAGMDGANLLAINWLRSAAETVAQRQLREGGKLPVEELEQFLADTSHEPRARRLAYELIASVDETARERLIPGLLNDPSLELRRDAVAMALDTARALPESSKQAAIVAFREALSAARDLDQIKEASEALEKMGEKVNLPRHFGFIQRWHVVAPFDNTDKQGFDVPYPPEKEVDLQETYTGKEGAKISWVRHETSDPYGIVDLNAVIAKHKGAIAYAYTEFVADRERDVELRLGCINANKIWLNGELLTANEVYHANMQIDQYKATGRLKKGRNRILLKIAQNEQTEAWAQRWQFQLRVCDQYGTAVLSQDRPLDQTASLPRAFPASR